MTEPIVYSSFEELYAHIRGKVQTVEPKEYVEPVKKAEKEPEKPAEEPEKPKKRARKKKEE